MNAWVLDSNFRAISLLDVYISLIWTERYNSAGDFELIARPEFLAEKGLYAGNYISLPDSETVMRVEDHEIDTDPEEGNTLVVTGKSLESILSQRIVWTHTYLDGSLQEAVRKLIVEAIINPSNTKRKIDNFIFRRSWDPEIVTPVVDSEFFGETLEKAIQDMLAVENLGYKITLDKSGHDFVEDCYKVLGEGWAINHSANKLSYQEGRRSNCIIFEARPDKEYSLRRNLRTYGWTIGAMTEIPTDEETEYTLSSSVEGGTDGTSVSITTPDAESIYLVVQTYGSDLPVAKTLAETIEGLEANCDMGNDYPSHEFAFRLVHGYDRSEDQSDRPRVIFAPSFNNIGETSFISSTKTFKSDALVVGEGEGDAQKSHAVSCKEGEGEGVDRYELFVDAKSTSSSIGEFFDEESHESFPEKTYFDYETGTIKTDPTIAYKCIIFEATPNTTFLVRRNLEDRKAFQYQVGAFAEKPVLGASCIEGQKWKTKKGWANDPFGQFGKGNIDLWDRPLWKSDQGVYETVAPIIFEEDGKFVVITSVYTDPHVTRGVAKYSEAKSIAKYKENGLYLGKFETRDEANIYAKQLDENQKLMYPDYAESIKNDVGSIFVTGDEVKWIAMTINDSATRSKTFAALTEGMSISGTLTLTGYENKLDEAGLQKLSENKKTETFEGVALPMVNYSYGKDYFMGDVVTIENEYGMTANQRITEFIRSQDPNNYTEVPTFSIIDKEEEET